jgi:hypothetical protein
MAEAVWRLRFELRPQPPKAGYMLSLQAVLILTIKYTETRLEATPATDLDLHVSPLDTNIS